MARRRFTEGALLGTDDPSWRISRSMKNISTVMAASNRVRTAALMKAALARASGLPLRSAPLPAIDAMIKHYAEPGICAGRGASSRARGQRSGVLEVQ